MLDGTFRSKRWSNLTDRDVSRSILLRQNIHTLHSGQNNSLKTLLLISEWGVYFFFYSSKSQMHVNKTFSR